MRGFHDRLARCSNQRLPLRPPPIDGTLICSSTSCQSGPGSNSNEGVLHILHISKREPHHQIQFNIISRTLIWKGLSPRQKIKSTFFKSDSYEELFRISKFKSQSNRICCYLMVVIIVYITR